MTEFVSPIFGSLALFHVEEGSMVEKGEAICEVEAMKVNYRVEAPTAGKIKFFFDLGEVVGEGDVIGEIEE